jgi:hypothetical protein
MRRRTFLTIALLLVFLSEPLAEGYISVGVKKGDWIEYKVNTTGDPPDGFNITWGRMEIVGVEGSKISANITTLMANGTVSHLASTFDVEKGRIGAWFIIPPNLDPGDSFYDELAGRNITIQGEEQLTYAGAKRAINNVTTSERIKRWDKSTGVFVLCVDVLDNFSMTAKATRTNMWETQEEGQNLTAFYSILQVVSTAIIVVAGLIFLNRRRAFKHFA